MQEAEAPEGIAGAGLVRNLHSIDAGMLAMVGGKAANLGELMSAGLPVPDGFCLTTEAYRQVTGAPRNVLPALAGVHAALKPASGVPGPSALADLAARARNAILTAPIPAGIAAAVEEAYRSLGPDVPVAVRSSATAEDLPFASFAGQQDTYLNVVGVGSVLEAVRKCWASLWTERATAYRASLGIDPADVALAVVVQQMVEVETAGVLFTANPVTGRRGHAVMDASPGLGEAVVSGAVNPDHYVVDAVTGRILERKLGDKRVAVRALPGGGTGTVDMPDASGSPCLTDSQAATLAGLGRHAEQYFGVPQDIEWAIDHSGALWLTQSRPITTLYPVPRATGGAQGSGAAQGNRDAGGTRVYLCFSLAQGLTRPITPMGRAALRLIASSVATAAGFDVPEPRRGPSPYAEAGQRTYFDLTTPLRSTVGRRILPRIFDIMEARSARVLRQLFDDPAFSVNRRTAWGLFRHIVPAAVRAKAPGSVLRGVVRPTAALRRLHGFTDAFDAALEPPAGAGAGERLDHAEWLLRIRLFSIVPAILPLPALGFAMLAVAGKLLGGHRWDELQPVLRGLPNNVTTEMDLELWRLAVGIRDDAESRTALMTQEPSFLAQEFLAGRVPPRLEAGLTRFLDRYGHRSVAEIDVGLPRWSDDPSHILGVLANYLRLEDPGLAPDVQFSKAAEAADAQVERLVAQARGHSAVHALMVSGALRRARLFAGLRELPKYQLVLCLAEVRRQLLHVGNLLAEAGSLDQPDDIFFLDFGEAWEAVRREAGTTNGQDMRELVAERRAAYAWELGRRHIPRVLLSDGTEPEALQPAARTRVPGALTGSPASAGSVTANARVILDPVGARLEPGEILVAPSTDPGWTPLFLTAGGLVMEMGGANSHGAVVAREYGIPAVVGVPDATGRIVTGQRITVDGGAGTVVPA
ncbi:PEP/pyruvate-binding domain-containing protein [Pseudarthrobacter sp. NS4]|uniref:PEP/pyruvate-binding domain-containing protein n=1 Tax=Pseudarthrobacter sp. NS4 TaxID=2973976 RepID=UPI00216375A9|nr:PEP/pyruvate-binding domain-containing protein [Pseudarthrobacter sp. NS4]